MNRGAWYFSTIIFLSLLILIPMDVFAQENISNATIPAQDPYQTELLQLH